MKLMMKDDEFLAALESRLAADDGVSLQGCSMVQLHNAISRTAMSMIGSMWNVPAMDEEARTACYFSLEFLVGRAVHNNLYCLGILDKVTALLAGKGVDIAKLEDIPDAALGNGGLGRLAACFLDSAATCGIPLDGYGIRYRYGLFRQSFENGFQQEEPDDWLRCGDPWSIRREEEAVTVEFAGQSVRAVPYDMPVIGYGEAGTVRTLRLWQSEPLAEGAFDFAAFNRQEFDAASHDRTAAEAICALLYPNDDTEEGKRLRIKQQYFFCSASLQDLLRRYKARYGSDFSHGNAERFAQRYAIQLNDTHPTVAIPELIRLLMFGEGLPFAQAFAIAQRTFAYTNHTVMAEALEKWSIPLFKSVLPTVYEIIVLINKHLQATLASMGKSPAQIAGMEILSGDMIHMARLAVYATSFTNGVAQIHSGLLTTRVFRDWYELFPERFQNKTNGITQRRWLGLCNRELSGLITELLRGEEWLTDLSRLKALEQFANDAAVMARFMAIKQQKRTQLATFIQQKEGIVLNPASVFDVQVKRLHEYKRQLLNAFSILDIYFGMKEGRLRDMPPVTFLFGAKAAPSYRRAKAVIKYIAEIANLVNNDPEVNKVLSVVFVSDYNVSYAERIIPAADISEQISTAGTEASGTGNMKLMLNGAVTLGTYDGANVEIVEAAGWDNNYIFGARVEDIERIRKTYKPKDIYHKDMRVQKIVNTLVDGTFNDGDTGMFYELYKSLLDGASWHKPDHYFLLLDLVSYCDTKLRCIYDYKNRDAFARRCWMNIANSGKFSSDRTVREYAADIWHV